jgi:hypothetical protein
MARVGGKILEITQNALEKSRIADRYLLDQQMRMKQNLVFLLSQKENLNL